MTTKKYTIDQFTSAVCRLLDALDRFEKCKGGPAVLMQALRDLQVSREEVATMLAERIAR